MREIARAFIRRATMKVPLLDLKAQYDRIGAELRRAIDRVLTSQQFILGKTVEAFEKKAAAYLGCGHAVGVASGSDALLLSLMALGIGAGDAVLVPPFTFFSTVSCITRLGALPIFVDIDRESCLLDAKKVEALLQEPGRFEPGPQGLTDAKSRRHVKALLPVHLFGQCCAMEPLVALAQRHRLHVVEDVAQACGAIAPFSGGSARHAGTVGDAGCFSFFPTKNLGAMGDAGMIATNREDLAGRLRMLRVHGANSKYHHQAIGLNSRLDALQAAVLTVKLRHLDEWCEERIERARLYQNLFSETGLLGGNIVGLPPLREGKGHTFNYYVIRVKRRDELKRYLAERGIQTEVYYPVPLHLQPCFASLGHRRGDFPNSERAASEVLALPMYPELTPAQQQAVARAIRRFFRA